MSRKYNRLQVGSKVLCQYFNTPENRFYGNYWEGEVIEILKSPRYSWMKAETWRKITKSVKVRNDNGFDIWLHRKEIKRVLS